jgi:hypothetical protein
MGQGEIGENTASELEKFNHAADRRLKRRFEMAVF